MEIGKWHPGKIFLMWFVVLGSWFVVRDRTYPGAFRGNLTTVEYDTPLVWYVAVVVAGVVTWRWFTAREDA